MILGRETLTYILGELSATDRGGPVAEIFGFLDELTDAGYHVEVFKTAGERVYRATDPETGERQQVATAPGAVTDWTAARGVSKLWRLI